MINRYILIILFTAIPLYSGSSTDTDFNKIINDYLSVKNVKGAITQHIYAGDGSVEVYTGLYYAASGGLIRIDYFKPERQTVVVNSSGLYWYYPERKILFRTVKRGESNGDIPALTDIIPAGSLTGVQIVSEGSRFYSFFKTASVYSITSGGSGTRFLIWLDAAQQRVIRKYIIDSSGREMLKEEYIEHSVINGVSIPVKIDLKARSAGGIIHTVTEYTGLSINSRMGGELFKFRVTPDMDVRELNGPRN